MEIFMPFEDVGAQTKFIGIEKFAPASFLGGSALISGAPTGTPFSHGFEPQRKNNGLIFAPIPELKAMSSMPNSLPILGLALKSMELPKDENDTIDLGWFNQRVKFAGQHHTDDINITFNDYIDSPVMHILESWRASVYNPKLGAVNYASGRWGFFGSMFGGYKHDVYMLTFSPNIDWVYTKVFKLRGAFPIRLDRGDIDYSDDEVLEASLTLSYDEVTFEMHGYLPEFVLYYTPQSAGAGSYFSKLFSEIELKVS